MSAIEMLSFLNNHSPKNPCLIACKKIVLKITFLISRFITEAKGLFVAIVDVPQTSQLIDFELLLEMVRLINSYPPK